MTEPATPTPAAVVKPSKWALLLAFVKSPAGKTWAHRLLTGALALYTALHRAGV